MRNYQKAVRIARHHRLVSPEFLEWAHLGYFPTPAERAGGPVIGLRPPFPRPQPHPSKDDPS
ncbi:hypothetical protein [Euzebya rosea]|uniref:hypothetical protein n=1 Tax=Euzebya rosea TaxID=2052804 RepID=UPI000D3E2979|nr:hypothetical protein [Euzebya rosea]